MDCRGIFASHSAGAVPDMSPDTQASTMRTCAWPTSWKYFFRRLQETTAPDRQPRPSAACKTGTYCRMACADAGHLCFGDACAAVGHSTSELVSRNIPAAWHLCSALLAGTTGGKLISKVPHSELPGLTQASNIPVLGQAACPVSRLLHQQPCFTCI